MVASHLQDALVEEVKEILKDIITQDISGERVEGVNVFAQQLPVFRANEGDTSKTLPHAIVELLNGTTVGEEPWTVTVGIHLGVCDTDRGNQGHRHVMVMIQRIIDRFISDPLLDDRYLAQPEMEWALDTETLYPEYYGGVCIKFSVPKIGRRMTEYD